MFEHLGYFKEYFIGNTSIGCVFNCEKDRENIGYNGKIKEISELDIVLHNGRKIKKGIEHYTLLYPLCGKMKYTYENAQSVKKCVE